MFPIAIDISHYQGRVDFQVVKSRNVAMVYMKCTDGTTFLDPIYGANVDQAVWAKVNYSSYHFFQPGLDGKLQAEWFAKNVRLSDEPPVVDVEAVKGYGSLSPQRLLDCVKQVEALTDRQPTIYTGYSHWKTFYGSRCLWAKEYRLWIASYRDFSGPLVPFPWHPLEWYLWQYGTPTLGIYYGVSSKDVDVSIFNLGGPILSLG